MKLFYALPLIVAGCTVPQSSTGWRFEAGKPAVVNCPTCVEHQPGHLAVQGLGAGSVAPPAAYGREVLPPPRRLDAPQGLRALPQDGCLDQPPPWEAIERSLGRIERSLASIASEKRAKKAPRSID